MKHVVCDVYVSDDGKREFSDKDECLKYDQFVQLRDLAQQVSRHRIDDVEFANFVLDNWGQIHSIMSCDLCAERDALRAVVEVLVYEDGLGRHFVSIRDDVDVSDIIAPAIAVIEKRQTATSRAAADVLAERRRQIEAEGWTPEHDDAHRPGSLARAAGIYASNAGAAMSFGTNDTSICNTAPYGWPWAPEWWKPKNSRRDLVKAGALIIAEIERIDRAAEKGGV